ncbi:MAG TPA: PRC-barrel domain-containing protein [Vicinamibacterales bacterium]|nr:PRC-barrel domain-containing protein [Vicinamibacterales bacterium]
MRYIGADHVDTPQGALQGTMVVGPRHEPVGTLDGLVIDPIEKQVRYLVVRSRKLLRSRRHLVPLTPARLDAERKTLHVDVGPDDLRRFQEISADTFERYSDDDLIAALFPSRAA